MWPLPASYAADCHAAGEPSRDREGRRRGSVHSVSSQSQSKFKFNSSSIANLIAYLYNSYTLLILDPTCHTHTVSWSPCYSCFSLFLFIFLKYICSWFISCYCTCSHLISYARVYDAPRNDAPFATCAGGARAAQPCVLASSLSRACAHFLGPAQTTKKLPSDHRPCPQRRYAKSVINPGSSSTLTNAGVCTSLRPPCFGVLLRRWGIEVTKRDV